MSVSSYPDSVEYLYALGNEFKTGAKFGLERMQALLEGLEHPERGQRLVHVAGTNGKGSTCATLAAMLQAEGYRAGLYTSPHLVEPTERIQIDGQAVTADEFAAAFDRVHRVAVKMEQAGTIDAHPSYFETVTAMAFLIFKERAEISVMEVGLGGRLDATNVLMPELTAITPIAYDHQAYLGNTLASIAGEKAGILKTGVPAVFACQEAEADEVLVARAKELGCPVTRLAEPHLELLEVGTDGSAFLLNGEHYECRLRGRHQAENAAMAVLCARQLGVATAAIQHGLDSVSWPGRLERVCRRPDVFLDGAHNPAGAQALAEYIQEFVKPRPVWMVFGAMKDKAVLEIAETLFPLAERLIVTAPDLARALRPEEILAMTPHENASVAETTAEALKLALQAPGETAILVTGSLYLVGEAKHLLSVK